MFTQRITRRVALKAIGTVAATVPIGTAAVSQEPVPFPIPNGNPDDPNDPVRELFDAYDSRSCTNNQI